MCHHAIVVTSYADDAIEAAHRQATKWGAATTSITDVTRGAVNGYRSFLIAPDGSKEGWPDSQLGDNFRNAFVRWLTDYNRRGGHHGWLDWVEVQFGDDNHETIIVRDSDHVNQVRRRLAPRKDAHDTP